VKEGKQKQKQGRK